MTLRLSRNILMAWTQQPPQTYLGQVGHGHSSHLVRTLGRLGMDTTAPSYIPWAGLAWTRGPLVRTLGRFGMDMRPPRT